MNQASWTEHVSKVSLPSPTDLIYPVELAPSSRDPIPRFGDDVWTVRFFSNNPSMQNVSIPWRTFPQQYAEHFRTAVWALFNLPAPDEFLADRTGPAVSTLSALRIYHSAMDYRLLALWLEARGVGRVTDLDAVLMADYALYLKAERRIKQGTAVNHLSALTRLWLVGVQMPHLALAGVPPWVSGNVGDHLPLADRARGENDTEPIATPTISALLGAAMSIIEDGSTPILQALELHRAIHGHPRKQVGPGTGAATLRTYLEDLARAGASFPMKTHSRDLAKDCTYIAYVTGASLDSVYAWAKGPEVGRYAAECGAITMVGLGGVGLMPDEIPLTEIPTYALLLRSACFVVVTYLTGMRTGEALALEVGSMHASNSNGGWMLINSRTFKGARDKNGNHDSNGMMRAAPWVAISPVIKAIQTLEGLVEGQGLLFPSAQYVKNAGRSASISTVADGVTQLIEWVNAKSPGTIPTDPAGRVAPIRFRRTLAWHIANQPGGLVALAVQYGHLRTAISEGYASRVRSGIEDMVEYETARTIATSLSEVAEAMAMGEGVSGPAAARFVTALRVQAHEFNGIVTSQRQARSLLNNTELSVYQNDQALVWCNFRRETALCLTHSDPDQTATPRLDRCRAHCSNVARTDSQSGQLRAEADRLQQQAAVLPRPSAERLLMRAQDLKSRADGHDRTRRVLEDFDGEP